MSSYLNEIFGLQGKSVVVLGGSGRLCGEMALGLSKAGAEQVIITSRTLEKAEAKAAELRQGHAGKIVAAACDVTNAKSLEAFIASLKKLGVTAVHCLINGAGGNHPKATVAPNDTLLTADLSGFREVFDSNFISTHYATVALLPLLIAAKDASIINVGSMSGETPLSRVGGYSAAKAAVHRYTEWLAAEFATKKDQYGATIRVNTIAPGFFPAEQNAKLLFDESKKDMPFPENLSERGRKIIGHTPMGRFGCADDLIGTTILLASSKASRFITGALIPVDGGFSSFTL